MATQEKLFKSLEALKQQLNTSQSSSGDLLQKKKDKIQHCNFIAEAIQNPTIQVAKNFNNLLSFTIDILLKLCDDSESDVRMIADECLCKIIRGMTNGSISKVQIELHKGIKQNGPARSLRAALWRFGLLAHHIRPQKGKPYVTSIIPALIKVLERTEESVHETMATSLPLIMKALGPFTMDYDIKGLLKACLQNVQSASAVIRRMTASCILTVCLNSRGPYIFLCYVFNYLFDLLIPVQDIHSNQLILGAIGCIKQLIPHLEQTRKEPVVSNNHRGRGVNECLISTEKFVHLYELCLFYSLHIDHNVVNCSLETLNILLSNLTIDLKYHLLQEKGIGKSVVLHAENSKITARSPSQLSVATTLKSEENLLLDSDLTDFMGADIEKWIGDSKLSVINVNYVKSDEKLVYTNVTNTTKSADNSSSLVGYGNLNIGTIDDQYADSIKSESIAENMDQLILSENSSEKSYSNQIEEKAVTPFYESTFVNIDIGDILDHEVTLLYCTRFIAKQFLLSGTPGCRISDKSVRVSTKNLALTCISTIVQHYPNALLKYVDKNYCKISKTNATCEDSVCKQKIADILLYECHDDPQIRGIVRVLIANFVKAVLLHSFGDCSGWIKTFSDFNDDILDIKYFIQILLKGLQDESSTCTRQCLVSLNACLGPLLESEYSNDVIPVLNYLSVMAKDPYWLVKVKLLELVTSFYYVTVTHVTQSKEFQNKMIYNVLLELLKDEDQRVRYAASSAFIKIIPLLYFEQDQPLESRITTKAMIYRDLYSIDVVVNNIETNIKMKQQVANLPFPYSCGTTNANVLIEKSLSRIISKLYKKLISQNSKYYTLGCIEALCSLSNHYPVTVYRQAWNCFKAFDNYNAKSTVIDLNPSESCKNEFVNSNDLLSFMVSLMTNGVMIYDINFHLNVIKLAGNLLTGKWLEHLKSSSQLNQDSHADPWDLFDDKHLSNLSEEYLVHVVKILNIYSYVIEENHPGAQQNKSVIQNLSSASNLSPIKRRKSDLGEKRVQSPGKAFDKDGEKKSDTKTNTMGYFANSSHYMKMYDILKVAYNNYKVTLNTDASENFLGFLKVLLYSLCQTLEIATLQETGRIAEELLLYLKSTFILEPTTTVQCVQQLLKSLFNTNITSNFDAIIKYLYKETLLQTEHNNNGFFYQIAQIPINNLSDSIRNLNQVSKNEFAGDRIVMGYVHRKDNNKIINKDVDKILASYIKIFEPMVIKSLKYYTFTSDIKLQVQVLDLLSQLILLKVNYCLLDSEQIFIDFVLKQFQFMEEGQISLANALIPKIFQFLVHLSYGKQHTKSIIVVPKIIQLCDGLIASGQPPKTHCIPALKPIIEDIFLLRNKSNTTDFKELETTREVLVSMLLKLIEYSEILELLVLILNESKYCENVEKWPRWSKQIFSIFLGQLRHNSIELEDLDCMQAAQKLLFILHPSVYKPMSHIFISLFEEAIDLSEVSISRFMGKLNLLLLITSQLNEDKFLLKIEEVQAEIPPHNIFEKLNVIHDPLNVTRTVDVFDGIIPEVIILKYLFRTIKIAAQYCVNYQINAEDPMLVKQLSNLLVYCIYLFQSGTYNKITTCAIQLVNGDMEDITEGVSVDAINKSFLQLRPTSPLLSFQWSYILTLLNYNERSYWASVIQITDSYGLDMQLIDKSVCPKTNFINMEITRIGGSIVFADYLSEHVLTDGEQMSWFLVNNIKLLVENHEEPPIFEFLGSVNRNSSASGLLIQAIASKYLDSATIGNKFKILSCLEKVHESQSGTLLKLLLPKVLETNILAISRQAACLASRKIEYLLTLNTEEVCIQLPKDELSHILYSMSSWKLVRKHETLIGLLNKLSSQFYDLSPVEFDQRRSIRAEYIKTLNIDKTWYLTQIKQRCFTLNIATGYSEVLSKLNSEELISIMDHNDFNKKIIKDNFQWSTNHLNCDNEMPDLLKASSAVVIKNVHSLKAVLPKSHQVFRPYGRTTSSSEFKYSNRLTEILEDISFYQYLVDLVPCVLHFVDAVTIVPGLTIPQANSEDFARFGVTCLETISYIIDYSSYGFDVNFATSCLNCADSILKNNQLCNYLALNAPVTWICSMSNSLYRFISYLLINLEPLPSMPLGPLQETLNNVDTQPAGQAVHQLYTLLCWLEKIDFNVVEIPNYLMQSFISIVISLSRLPLFNSFVITPPTAWKSGWFVEMSGPFLTQVPPLPLEYLQEVDIFSELIFRIIFLGWTTRTQFEETWVSLLSALSSSPSLESNIDDINAITHSNSLAIQAITTFLLQTLLSPMPGNRIMSVFLHVPRDTHIDATTPTLKKLKLLHRQYGQKLSDYSECLKGYKKHLNVFDKPNIEKADNLYSYSQVSLEYLLISANMMDVEDDNFTKVIFDSHQRKMGEIGIDLRSCLQFQLDLFSQWFDAQESMPLRLLHEVVKSMVQISDMFYEKSQFQWMLNTFINISKNHAIEDELIHQYLVIGICKATAVLNPGRETDEYTRKLILQGLKSTFLSCRIAALHGLLFMLQMYVVNKIPIIENTEDAYNLLKIATEYIECNISTKNTFLQQSQEHVLLVWALVFYIIECVEISPDGFHETIFEHLMITICSPATNLSIYVPIVKGTERLLIKRRIPEASIGKIVKAALSQFKKNSPIIAIPAAQLLFTSLYIEYSEHIDKSDGSELVPSNPDYLVQSIEKISAIFDKIKRGYPFEVDLLAQSLSNLLTDIFSPSDILTKVISEFLSPHQRHPMQLCKIVFNVFESAIQQSQISLLQDWVVFSLTNFTQSFSIGMATWYLTCFFISASKNKYLRNLFPYIQRRMGRYEYEDRMFLCIAGTDFYNNLTSDSQKKTFLGTLVSVKDQADMPFNELLLCL